MAPHGFGDRNEFGIGRFGRDSLERRPAFAIERPLQGIVDRAGQLGDEDRLIHDDIEQVLSVVQHDRRPWFDVAALRGVELDLRAEHNGHTACRVKLHGNRDPGRSRPRLSRQSRRPRAARADGRPAPAPGFRQRVPDHRLVLKAQHDAMSPAFSSLRAVQASAAGSAARVPGPRRQHVHGEQEVGAVLQRIRAAAQSAGTRHR